MTAAPRPLAERGVFAIAEALLDRSTAAHKAGDAELAAFLDDRVKEVRLRLRMIERAPNPDRVLFSFFPLGGRR